MRGRFVGLAGVLLVLTTPGNAQFLKRGFALPPDGKSSVMVVCPDLFVGTIDSRQEQVLNPDWTRGAYANLVAALRAGPIGSAVDLRVPACDAAQKTPLLEQVYREINLRNSDVLFKVPPGTFPLPDNDLRRLKGLKGQYSYALNRDLLAQLRSTFGEADFGLFLTMHDAYTTAGAKAGKIAGALIGVPNTMPPHFANSMLVDLRNGDIVWTHMDGAVGGDVRTPDGARKRILQAARNFPVIGGKRTSK